ncbi:hypothetical protein BT96DRAFT_1013211 [Gymnopus androsaceus JB14]|uniref:Uncharacterized protein n=1 Tax=Gymnopus androsaceus JB14 TaxID=1447944 RepID=A0A6A4IF05_9AGAR|nr:hypothetical protein BT96DRAFT_1013211 [Gymnopus androsaceus JB14]
MRSILAQFMANRYARVKAENPGKGRRYWHLCVLQEFWGSNPTKPSPGENTAEAPSESVLDALTSDDDPYDEILSDVVGGIVIRTDFSDEEAWKVFSSKLKEAEEELSGGGEQPAEAPAEAGASTDATDVDMEDGNESDDSEEAAEGKFKLVKVVNPTLPEEQVILKDISNLRALRLFNDVDIRPCPLVPSGSKRISPPNRLVDFAGWQEIYSGVTLWIYDVRSNVDQSVRLVSAEGDVYGTATGDSWRARVSHIPDLQLNMSFENLKINFDGLDRWDYPERKRNLEEADVLVS